MKWGLPIGISLLLWGFLGFIRYIHERIRGYQKKKEVVVFLDRSVYKKRLKKVAVCVAAKNEALVIRHTINSIKKITSLENCYIVSDGSTDNTAEIARKKGCKVLEYRTSHGKGGALERLIKKFKLFNRYDYILFVDADTRICKDYLKNALAIFENEKYVAIAGFAYNQWQNGQPVEWKNFFIAYRARLYSLLQLFLSYGQTSERLNVLSIVPGFASMYRTSVLRKLELNTPGIIIEDFNLTFQLRKKKLGLVAHDPSMYGVAQDPTNLGDYMRQVKRWNLGFFQTAKTYGVWLSFFWFNLGLMMIEAFSAAIFFIAIPFLLIIAIILVLQIYLNILLFDFSEAFINLLIFYLEVVIVIFIGDYLLTLFIAIKDKKPLLAFYGLGFMFLRYIDAVVLFIATPQAFFVKSKGIWTSPSRG